MFVGAGSAGCVLANRLTENPSFKVLLLEAGGDPTPLNDIPALATYNLHNERTDWRYKAKPNPSYCITCKNNSVHLNRGKSLGGSSNLNLMIYQRGNPNDFDNWANLIGDSSWRYENVLPFFKKSEDYRGGYSNQDDYHGTGGPVRVIRPTAQPMASTWMQAGEELGFSERDPNGFQSTGFFHLEATIKDGIRGSTYHAFLSPTLRRKNLKVIRYAHVIKINFDDVKNAIGVTYIRHGEEIIVKARKEVVLAAGAINTPQLLMLSGIGDGRQLEEHNIPVVFHSPGVGANLQDHVTTIVGPFLINETVSLYGDRDLTASVAIEYATLRLGVLASNLISGGALFATSRADLNWPNIMALQLPLGIGPTFSQHMGGFFALDETVLRNYVGQFTGMDANSVLLDLARPRSKGSVKLKSSSPLEVPEVDLGYFTHPNDMLDMIDGVRFIVRLYEETKAFAKYGATLIPVQLPCCERHPPRSDAYYECFIRHLTGTEWHYCGTAKMGRDEDPMAVLDSQLRVRGVNGLRVIDASVMPTVTNANINAPVVMIAERGAEFVKNDWDR